jgi:hypothetical protein
MITLRFNRPECKHGPSATLLTVARRFYAIYLGAACAYSTVLRGTFGTYSVTMAKVPGALSISPKNLEHVCASIAKVVCFSSLLGL